MDQLRKMGWRIPDQSHFLLILSTPLSLLRSLHRRTRATRQGQLFNPSSAQKKECTCVCQMMHKEIQQSKKFWYIMAFAVLSITPMWLIKRENLWRIITVSHCGRWRGEHNPFHTTSFQAGVQHIQGALNTWINQSFLQKIPAQTKISTYRKRNPEKVNLHKRNPERVKNSQFVFFKFNC